MFAATKCLGRPFLAMLGMVMLVGAASPSVFPSRLKNADKAMPGQALIVGSIDFKVDGKPKKCQTFLIRDCFLVILPPEGTRAMAFGINGDGDRFRWSLPPGDYLIIGLETSETGITARPLRAKFTVTPDLRTTDIGKFTVLLTKDGELTGFRIEPDDQALIPADAVTTPMALEDKPGTYSAYRPVCATNWGIDCTKSLAGITPTSPAIYKDFHPVDGLRPTLCWSPARAAGVSYDVLVFEAASYKGVRDMLNTYIPGRQVDYQQGLDQPAWQPATPLAPNQRYFWSVRLRDGETVSDWSTYSYSNFYLVGWSIGYGLWFNFITPPAAAN